MKMVSLRFDGVRYWVQVDGGPAFLVGQRVSFQGRKGLSNLKGTPAQRYDPRRHLADRPAVWLYFLAPTDAAEGGLFHALNTYDRAAFTFGFLQYAAHVPDGDFVVYLRALLALPGAADHVPDLVLLDGRPLEQCLLVADIRHQARAAQVGAISARRCQTNACSSTLPGRWG